jgi:protein transport protein SEC20
MMVDDLHGEKKRKVLWGIVDDFKTKLERWGSPSLLPNFDLIAGKLSLRKDIRTALLTSKRAIDSRSKSNRDELLAFSSTQEKQETLNEKSTYVRYSLCSLSFSTGFAF